MQHDEIVSMCPREPLTRLVREINEFHVLRIVPDDAVRSAGSRDTVAGRLDSCNPGVANSDCTPASESGKLASIVIDQRDRVPTLREDGCVNFASFYGNKVIAIAVGARPVNPELKHGSFDYAKLDICAKQGYRAGCSSVTGISRIFHSRRRVVVQ